MYVRFLPRLEASQQVFVREIFADGTTQTTMRIVPKLGPMAVTAMATPVPKGETGALRSRTVFTVSFKVNTPFLAVVFRPPVGNDWNHATLASPFNTVLLCLRNHLVGSREQVESCSKFTVAPTPTDTYRAVLAPAGTYRAVIAFNDPVAPDTVLNGGIALGYPSVTSAGHSPLTQFIIHVH